MQWVCKQEWAEMDILKLDFVSVLSWWGSLFPGLYWDNIYEVYNVCTVCIFLYDSHTFTIIYLYQHCIKLSLFPSHAD